ncbi:protein AHNAK2-like [Gopherus evgoodei]|uniref:protein AHNAK2-like n=1 Tax=Gopherus evgoodei TaxID=1825980 RepID=UPI0011CF5DE5|nr:protein AHNAK2-like [Gopherus evgoodei]
MSHSQESMEVTLKTEVESGASGFSVTGGGNEGIFVKQVLKGSPASKIFSLREGDQLLSATIFFDNIKYEDALKILQYSEPYKVQFSLKRKLAGKEELEKIHSTAQHKKEKISQEKELNEKIPGTTLEISEKIISEEDKEKRIVKQRVGRTKRPRKERLSWPKFQSMKNKKISGHRRSHSTSDAHEHATQAISPTSADTESQLQQEEFCSKEKKGSQKKLKFPNIGFKMHRTKAETEEKQSLEIKTMTPTKKDKIRKEDVSMETPEILTVQYSASSAYETKASEIQDHVQKDLKDIENGLPIYTEKYSEVEINITKQKDQIATSKPTTATSQIPPITTEISKPTSEIQTPGLKDIQSKQIPQALPRTRKKKQKDSSEKKSINISLQPPEEGITNKEMRDHLEHTSVQIKGLEIKTTKKETGKTKQENEMNEECEHDQMQISDIKKENFGIYTNKGKKSESEITLHKLETDIYKKTVKIEATEIDMNVPKAPVQIDPVTEGSGWKMQLLSLKIPKVLKPDIQAPKVDITLPSEDVSPPIAEVEIQGPEATAKAVQIEGEIKATDKDAKGKESKFKMPKFSMPSFGWSTTKETGGGVADVEASLKEPQVTMPSAREEGEITVSGPAIQAPSVELDIGTSAGKDGEKGKIKMPDVKLPTVKLPKVKAPQVQVSLPKVETDISLPKSQSEIKEVGFEVKVPDMESCIEVETGKAEATGMKIHMPKVKMPSIGFSKPEIKAPKGDMDVTLHKVDVTLPTSDVSLQEADLKAASVPADVKISAPGVKIPKIEGSIQLKSPGIEVKQPSPEIAVEEPEGKAASLEGKIQMPKFEKPKFEVSLPKGNVLEGEISLPKMEADIPKPKVKGQVGTNGVETPTLAVEADVPDVETEVSGWKIQMPSLQMPKAEIEAPKMHITLPSVDVSLPKAEVNIQGPEATAKVVQIEGEIKVTDKDAKGKESKFKMPKFSMPSFGWSTTKETSGRVADVEASLKEPQVTMPSARAEGEITVSGPAIQAPSVELEIGTSAGTDDERGKIKMPDLKLPCVKLPEVKAPQVQVSLRKAEADISLPKSQAEIKDGRFEVKVPDMESRIEVETRKTEAAGIKIHMPKVKMPSLGFSKPEIKAPKGDVDVTISKVDVTLPTSDVSLQEADLKAASVPTDVKISAPGVKMPKIEGSIQLTGPGMEAKEKLAEFAVERTAEKAASLERQIQMPTFEKPTYGVSLPKGKGPEGEISLPKMEADIPKPKVKGQVGAIGVETPTLAVEADVPHVDTEVSGWKIQMPSLKMPKMPKADIQAPKVDITLPSVDVSLPKAEVDIQGPEATAKVVQIEGEIKVTDKDAKGKESKFKMPKFSMPSFGWSTTKETSGRVADVEASLKEPQVTMPSARAEGEITVSGPAIQAPSVELEIGTSAGTDDERGKIKMPDLKLPCVKLPEVKAPQVQVSLRKAEADISLPKSQAEIKDGRFEVKVPDMESRIEVETGKTEAAGIKIHMPKVKMPSLGFSKPEIKAPKGDVDVTISKVDVTLPTSDVSLQEADLKAASVPTDVKISAPGVKMPKIEGSIQLTGPGMEAKEPLAEFAVERTAEKAASLERQIQMPTFEKPTYGVSLPKGKGPEGEISLPKMEADIPKPKVKGQVGAIGVETPTLAVEADVPHVDTEVSGWKIQMPSLKMPKMPKADIQAPKVDITLPSVDVSLPKAKVDIKGPETTAKAVEIEGEIKVTDKDAKGKERKFKMPTFGMPSFGWSTSKETSGGVADVEASLKEPQVKMPSARAEGEITVSGPAIQAPSVELEIGTSAGKDGEKGKIKMPDVKLPSAKLPEVKAPQVQVSLPKVEADISLPKSQAEIKEAGFEVKVPDTESRIEVETGKTEAAGMKIHLPKVKMPSIGFSKPEIKAPKIDMDVTLPKVDVTLPTCDVSLQEADLKAASVPADVKISAPGVKMPKIEGSVQLKGPGIEVKQPSAEITVEGPEWKAAILEGKIQMPKFEKPKFGVSHPKGKVPEGEISLPKMEVDISKPKVKGQLGAIGMESPTLTVEADVPDVETEASGWKMQMPSLKMTKMPKADIEEPKVDITLPSVDVSFPKAKVDIKGPETTAKAVEIEGDIKATDKDAKGKERKFKMPTFGMPSFGWSTSKETSGGVADVEASLKEPQVTLPSAREEGEITVSGPAIRAPSVELEIGTSAGTDGEKGKIKMPDVKLPSVKLPEVKAPQLQVSLPKVEVDISLPKSQAEIKEAGLEVKVPDMESHIEVETGKAEATGMKIHLPKVKMPSIGFSKPEIKAPKGDVDISLPKADVTLPMCDVSLQEADLKAASVPADVKISAPGVKMPIIEGSVQLKGPGIEVKQPSAEIAVEGAEIKAASLEGKIQMPKFEKPKFGVSHPKGKVPEGKISLPKKEADIPKPKVKGQVGAIGVKTPTLAVEADVPDVETEASGWKMQMPSLKMPKMPKADTEAPKVDITLPSVDVSLPKAKVDIKGAEATTKAVEIESEIKATDKDAKGKESKFKMPKFSMPSFGWSNTKETSGGVADIEASLKEPQVTMPSARAEGEITVSEPADQAPSVEREMGISAGTDGEKGKIKMPDVKLPSVKLPKVKAPQVQVSLPKMEADISLPKSQAEIKEGGFELKAPDMESRIAVETGKTEAAGMKTHMPKVKTPSMGFSKPKTKAPKIDMDVTLPKVDVTLPTCDVSLQEADLKAASVPADVKISAPGVKMPKIEGSVQLKGPGIEVKQPSAEITVEGPEWKAAILEGKIQMPKFEKPKFGVSHPKGKVPEGEISLPKMEVDISKPKVKGQLGAIGMESPTLTVEADVPDVESEASGWKMQMPSLKMPRMPKADIEAPKVDITLPSVDVSLPKAKVDIKGPETTAKAVEIEGEIKATVKDTKGKERKFKMPTFGMPSFGWSTSKETSGGVADVEASLKEPQVTLPSAREEGEITVSGPAIQAPSVELEIGTSAGTDGEKGKIKMTDVKLPSVKLPEVKAPQLQVSLPKVEADISLPKSQAEIKEAGLEVKVPDMESRIEVETGKAEATGMKIHLPKVKMPSIGFSKAETKAPKGDVDISLPKADVTLPTCDVSLQEADLKAASVSSDVKISAPGVKMPKIEGSIQLKGPGIEVKQPSAEITVGGPEGKAAILEGKIQMPKFEKPKFGVSHPKDKVPEGKISLPKKEADIPKPKVKGQVGAIGMETPTLAVEDDVPDVETEASGWKMQMPSLKMPKMPRADTEAPKVDITLPSVDVSIPKAEVEIKGPEATAKEVEIEGEIKATDKDAKGKESKFKMPKFSMPSFGWSNTKETSGGVADIEASLKEPQVTMPSARAEGEITVSGPAIQAPSVEREMGISAGTDGEKGKIKMPDVKLPSVKLPKVKDPQVQVSLPKMEADISLPKSQAEIKEGGFQVKAADMESRIEVETGKTEAAGMKIHMPKVKMPSMGFSKPKTKAPKIDMDVTLPKVDVTLPTCDVSLQEADLKAASVSSDVKISAPGVKMPKIEGSIQLKGPGIEVKQPSAEITVGGPEGKAAILEGKIQMPKFEKPKFGVSHPKDKVPEGKISLPKKEADIPKPKVKGQVGAIGMETPTLAVEADVPDVETEASGWKMQMPSLKMPKMPRADIEAPKVDITLPSVDVSIPKAEVEIKGPEATAKEVEIEGEIKATDKDAKGKESKFKMPKFSMPSFGWSNTKETSGGVADIEASLKEPQVTMPSARAEGEITVSGPAIQAPSVEREMGISAGTDGEKGKIKMPDVKLPSVKLPKVKDPQVQVSLPKMEADISLPKSQAEIKEGGFQVKAADMESRIEVETGKTEAAGMKIHMPKVKMPSMGFSKPKTKAPKIDMDVTLPKVDVTLPTCDVSLQEADLKAASVPTDVKISAPGVKMPKIEGSVQLKGPGIEVKQPSAEITEEGPEGKAAILEGKIQMPKFEKPKFGVSRPKGKVPEGEISLPKKEVDVPKPKVKGQVGAIGMESPTLTAEADVPDVETEASSWKMQMPSLKMPKMPKADIEVPKVDITLPSVDVPLPTAKVDIKGPEATAKAVEIEGEIKATDKDAKGKGSILKMPTFGMPSFGWSTSKETSGGVADVEASLKEPQVTLPSAREEGEITVSGLAIQAPSVELEIGTSAGTDGEKGKIKMPDVKLPSVKFPEVKATQVQISLPKVEADISLPKSQAEIKEAGLEVKVPDMESHIEVETGKTEATGMKIHMPKIKMPSLGFSKSEIRAPKGDVDITISKVDVTLPTCDVSLQEADLKAASVPADVKISTPGVKMPKIEGSIQLKGPGIEVKQPSAEIAVEGAEIKAASLEGKIQMPKFEKPKFGISRPEDKVPEGEISLSKKEADIPKPKVKGQVGAIGMESPTLTVEADVPDVETEASSWNMQMQSLKMPKMPKADIEVPKVDITLPSVDVPLPTAKVDIKGPEATAKAVEIEGEIKATEKGAKGKESILKMPTFGMPSFGWSTSKETSGRVADVEASLKEFQVTLPSAREEGEIKVSGPAIQAPSVELEIGTSAGKDGEKGKIKMPDVKLPSVKLPEVKAPQVQVSLPKVEADISLPKSQAKIKEGGFEVKVPDIESRIEVETGKTEATGMKIHMPKVKMPSLGFSKPEIKAPKGDVDVTISKVDVTLPTCDVSLQEAGLKAASVPTDVKISTPGVKMPKIEGSVHLKGPGIEVKQPSAEIAVEGAEIKAASLEGKIQMPKFEKPKFGVSRPECKVPEGEISLPKMEADIPKPKVKGQVGAISVETPTLTVYADVPDVETEASGWKMQMPSLKMPKMPKADIEVPKVDITLPSVDVPLPTAKADIKGPETTSKAVEIEGEIKATDKDAKGKESKFKLPTFGMPSLGWSTSKETSGGVADVEASLKEPLVTMPSTRAEGEISVSGPTMQPPSFELEIETSAGKDDEKGKIKMPDVKLPSVKFPEVKAPQVQVSLPKVEADISLPKSQAKIKEGGFEVKVPDIESRIEVETGKTEATGMKIHMPKVKMPSLGFSKPEIKAPKGDVDVTISKVDVTLPTCDVSLQEADLKAASVPADVKISAPRVKMPKIEGSVHLKGPGIEVKQPSAEITIERPEGKASGLEGKIHMLKFEKPKFAVSRPKGKVLESEISLPKKEADIPKPKVKGQVGAIGVETPTLAVEASVPDVETDTPGWKMQMPSLKMPKMPKADIQAPKVDITLPSVDVSLPKAEVEIKGPETTAKAVEIEGEIKATDKDAKGKESKFKMPKFSMPSFGWSTSKETSGGVADVEASLKEPQVTMPSARAEGEIIVSGPAIQAPSIELEIGTSAGKDGEKGKIKMPDVKLPSVKLPEVKAPQLQVSLPKVEADISLPKSQAEIKEGRFEVKVPDMESHIEVETGKAEATGIKIHMPKVRMPSIGFSKPGVKAPKGDMDVTLPKVDVTLPTCDVSLQEADLKAASVPADVKISAPRVKMPKIEGSVQLKGPGTEGKQPSAEITVEGPEGKAASLEGKIQMPKFEKPKFEVSLPKGKVLEEEISLPKKEADIPKSEVRDQVGAISVETPTLAVEADVPNIESEVSGWKIQMPSLKMPKADTEAPKVDISLPSVDVSFPKAEVEIKGPEATAKAVEIEGEIKVTDRDAEGKHSKFKMPKFKVPSFSWSPKIEAVVICDTETTLEEPTLASSLEETEAELTLTVAEVQCPSVDLESDMPIGKDGEKGNIKKPQFSMPKISLPKMKGHKGQVSLPKLESDVSGPKPENEGDVSVQISEKGSSGDREGITIKMPKVKISTSEFSKFETKAPKMAMDVSLPTVDLTLPTYDATIQQADLKLRSAGADVGLSSPDIKIPTSEGSTELQSPEIGVEGISAGIAVDGAEMKVEGLEGKIKMPKVQNPKFAISHPKGKVPESEINLSKMEADVPQLKAMTDIVDIAVEAPTIEVESAIPNAETESSGWKTEMPKISEADIKTPKVDINLQSNISVPMTEISIQDSNMASKATMVEEEIKPGDTDMEGKEGHFKLPKFKLPSFSWSPKKEASIKADSEALLEEPRITVSSGKTDTKLAEIVTKDQGPSMDLDIEISTGKEEQKSQIKKPQFIMPKISFSKIKAPKSQVNLPKVEGDVTVPKPERDGEDLVQIPDIESSHTKSTEEGAQINIKMPKVQIHTLDFSKPEVKVPKSDMDISLPKADATFPTYDVSLQQADLKLRSAGDDVSLSPGIKFPTAEASIELKSPETGIEGPLAVDGAEVKAESLEGKMKMPKFQKPKFGISLPKGKRPESEISLPKMESGVPQLTMTTDIADIAVEAPILEIKSDVSHAEIEVSAGKMKMPQVSITDSKAPKMDVSLPSVSVSTTEVAIQSPKMEDMKVQIEHEMKSGEIQTEEHQGWFKMPKFRMLSFGRSSSKEKRGDIDSEGSLEKPQVSVPSAEMQTEIEAPKYATSLPYVDTESAAGKDVLEGKIKSAKAEIPKVGFSLHKGKSYDVTSSKFEAEVSLPPEKVVIKVSIPETETYADVVKRGTEGQQLKTYTPKVMKPKVELSTSEISASKTRVDISLPKADITLPKCDLTLQEQKAKSERAGVPAAEHSIELKSPEIGAKAPSVEIALDGTQKKLDVLPKVELDILHAGAGIKTEKLEGVIKSTEKDVQGRESKSKMPKFSVPSFGWPATKGTGDVADVKTNLEETKIGAPGIKMDTEISVVDHEIQFPAESVEKDISAGVRVKVEGGDEASKMKTSKFKMPKFGALHSKAKGSEVDVFLPKLEAEVSLPKTELGIVDFQFKKADGSIDLQSPSSDLMEPSTGISKDKPDKQSESVEINIKIPKLKIPAFTYNAPTAETDISTSKVATDLKGAGTDNETPKLEVSTRIPKERPEFAGGNIQTPSVKIPTLAECDIKTSQVYVKLPSTDFSVSKAALQIQGPLAEGKDIKIQSEVESGHGDIETRETYTSQIVKESEIPSSEIKTASFGFSLLKVKIPESHVKLDMPVKPQSYTEYKHEVSKSEVHQPKLSDATLGVAIQKTDSAESKLSGKQQNETDESNDVISSSVSLPQLKTFTVEVQPSSKLGDTQSDKQPEEIAVSPLSKDDKIAKIPEDEEKDMKDEKEKTDSKRSSGRFKFWLPSIGFSSSVDDTGSDSKPEVQKSIPEEIQPVDSSASDTDSSKQTEKTGWFRFPKLGFSSPSKKAKNIDKEEETNLKEMKTSDDESPSEKPETFFDAEESLSPKEETIKGEENETTGTSSNVQVSGAIVTSSARTELILLEREKASQQSILEKTTK